MPLLEMSPNIQETELAGRKRSHEEFADESIKIESSDNKGPVTGPIQQSSACLLSPTVQTGPQSSPQASPALTEAGSSTARKSPSPETPTKSAPEQMSSDQQAATSGSGTKAPDMTNPAVKRQRLTTATKEAREKEAAEKKKEREEKASLKAAEKVQKAAEKAKADEEKAARNKEREEKRKKKEEEEREKTQQRDEKKRRKDEELRRIQKEKENKARSQKTLNNFFSIPGTPKKMDEAAIKIESPSKDGPAGTTPEPVSQYNAMFKPFFVKKHTRLAKPPTQMDEETREAKSQILDEFISGQREHNPDTKFNPVELFITPGRPSKRGRLHHPVKHIMEQAYKEADSSGSAGANEANHVIKQARKKLATVPLKVIAFSQDVRPPYYGTVTFKPYALGNEIMNKLARRSMGRRLPLDYEYDSEAEWQDDDGEDLDIDDDEEELEDEDDMDGFLDDSEDAGVARRVFGNAKIEPDSTGICFEDQHRVGPSREVYENAMEFMHEGLEHNWGIDPFSSQYWEPEPKAKTTKTTKTTKTAKAAKTIKASPSEKATKMPPPPAPANAFAALTVGAGPASRPEKMVKDELLNDVKQAILSNKALSKVGIVDFVYHQFQDSVSRIEVRNTLEYVAEKQGRGRTKEWALKPGHEITT